MWWFLIGCIVITIVVISFLLFIYSRSKRTQDIFDKICHIIGIFIKIAFCIFGYVSVMKFINNDITLESLIVRLVGMIILYFYFKDDDESIEGN